MYNDLFIYDIVYKCHHGNREKEYHLISVAVISFVCPIDF